MSEQIIWQSRPSLLYKWPLNLFLVVLGLVWLFLPSQYLLFKVFDYSVGWFIFLLAVFLVLCIVFSFLSIWTIKYKFSNQRIFIYSGIFSRTREEIELYRIKDYKIVSPFIYRIFFLSNVIIFTSDHSSPVFTLFAIKNSEEVTNTLRLFVEENRKEKSVRQFDL